MTHGNPPLKPAGRSRSAGTRGTPSAHQLISKENTRMSTAPALDPAHTALLVMDYQPSILAALPEDGDREALLGRMEGAIADVRATGAHPVGRRSRAARARSGAGLTPFKSLV